MSYLCLLYILFPGIAPKRVDIMFKFKKWPKKQIKQVSSYQKDNVKSFVIYNSIEFEYYLMDLAGSIKLNT